MAPRNEAGRLAAAWRALSGSGDRPGWRIIGIDVRVHQHASVLAGRRFPGDHEAILVGFSTVEAPGPAALPQGKGFEVAVVSEGLPKASCWLALSRRAEASREMFEMMAEDVIQLLERHEEAQENDLFHLFLGHIRAWQEFMERGSLPVLGPEAEAGLFGELEVLMHLIAAGMMPSSVIESWQGPARGLHDFAIGSGAIEVKTAVSSEGFPARVSSLEQFDETLVHPLFCAAVRLAYGETGMTLPEKIEVTRRAAACDVLAAVMLETRLVQAGFIEAVADRYSRRFRFVSLTVVPVARRFPRLVRRNMPEGIIRVRYEIDLDAVPLDDLGLTQALELLRG